MAVPVIQTYLKIFNRHLQLSQIDLPEPKTLPNDPNGKRMPFLLIGDEAFALTEHLLRP